MLIIVGSGLAAVRAGEAYRESGGSMPIVMVGAERGLPYDRPPLSKEFLRGETTLDDARIHGGEFFRERRIEVLDGTAARHLRASSRLLETADGRQLAFEKLLIATGATPRRLLVPGADLDGVLTLRTRDDAMRLKLRLAQAERVVVVGAGLIGLEVAAVARAGGKAVTVIEAARQPLARLLHGDTIASAVADLHRDHGIVVRTMSMVTEFCGTGHIEEVVLATGERIRADLVLVAIGVTPTIEWLIGSGIDLDDGVLADAMLETNVAGIYAAGDVARAFQPELGRHVRFEHYGSAHEQGIIAGRNLAGAAVVPNVLPGAGTEQFGVRMQIIGDPGGAERTVVRGSLERRSFTAFFLVADRIQGAFLMNRARELPAVRKLVAQRARVDGYRLENESVPLAEPEGGPHHLRA